MEADSVIAARQRQAPAGFALGIVIIELIGAGWRAAARHLARLSAARRHAQLRRELNGLSDHFLKDIGLRRDQIDRMFH